MPDLATTLRLSTVLSEREQRMYEALRRIKIEWTRPAVVASYSLQPAINAAIDLLASIDAEVEAAHADK